MATSQNKAPSFFNFLRDGLLLPSRNPRIFALVLALILASTALIDLAVRPHAHTDENKLDVKALNTTDPGSLEYSGDKIHPDVKALNTTEPGSPVDFSKLLQESLNGIKEVLIAGAGYNLFTFAVHSAVRIVVLFAAVFTYPGQERNTTFGALLGQAKARIKGPLLTLAFVYVLETVLHLALLAATPSLLIVLMAKHYFVALIVASLLFLAALVFLVYFSFLCSFSVVVAVAEPGCYGAIALGKAWRLVEGKKRQVAMYLAITGALAAAVSPVRTLGTTWAGNSVSLGLLLSFVCAVLLALVQLFSECAMTAFYYERKDQKGATGYAKLL